jgi:N-formylglutamate amidohydrolase
MIPELGSPIEILRPARQRGPLVVSSPHSGRIYPRSLLRLVDLDRVQLHVLEDSWVDRLFGGARDIGAPLLLARFARAYVDPNREAYELDAELFDDTLPSWVNAGSAKARAGLGTIPSRIAGQAIYRARLPFSEAERRVRLAYRPYHDALEALLAEARAAFGRAVLLDCHSMPSLAGNGAGNGHGVIDFALGDRFGRSCAPAIVDRAEARLRGHGFVVARNRPYAGGHITTRHGRPDAGIHALQIEVRRGLFMDEVTRRPNAGMAELREVLGDLMDDLVAFTGGRAEPATNCPATPATPS